ncbi:MAG TPA: hypothetical protein PK760_00785, partial [Flavobacteriales bacterium]|nr:hypothetical protein [Flavobacteriales bacterium]
IGARMVVVFWGSNAPIKSVDRNTGTATTLVTGTGLTNIDGITIDCLGNCLVASWSPDRITRYEPTFTQAGVNIGANGLNNPADIDFDTLNNRVCIPNAGNNTVTLFDYSCKTGMIEKPVKRVLRAIPNPTTGLVRVEPSLDRNEAYILLDQRGLMVGGGTVHAGSMLDITKLPAALYSIVFTRTGERLRVVKE